MVLRAVAVLCLVAVSLSGCSSGGIREGILPSDWNKGAPLAAYQVGGTHSGARAADLYPDTPLSRPTNCISYRDADLHPDDTCEIRDAKYSWENKSSWVIDANWAGCPGGGFNGCPEGNRPGPYQQRVVAYDQIGRPMAWWDGATGPHTMHWTE